METVLFSFHDVMTLKPTNCFTYHQCQLSELILLVEIPIQHVYRESPHDSSISNTQETQLQLLYAEDHLQKTPNLSLMQYPLSSQDKVMRY